ncbi:MAG: hypothetical protein MJA29_01075, partial [Candidatus Omnitrophica bacterium]|nr:hypothetical protein [Candidatus Omnitrophota bacterium]
MRNENVSNVGVSHAGGRMRTILPTARVIVRGENGTTTEANVLLDTGADLTYVSSSLVSKIRPKWVGSEPIAYASFGGKSSNGQLRNMYDLHMSGVVGSEGIDVTAVEIPVICAPLNRPQIPNHILDDFSGTGILFADPNHGEGERTIDILVGIDWYWDLVKGGLKKHKEGPVAQETIFGWVISGSVSDRSSCVLLNTVGVNKTTYHTGLSHQLCCLNDISESTVRKFWDLDSIGIVDKEPRPPDGVLEKFEETIQFKDGRYEVTLPSKENFGLENLLNN